MKRFAFATIILLGLTISCTPSAMPQPQIALATVTLQPMTATATAIPTDTSTPTRTPSPTATPTSTSTPTVTPLPKPTPTPSPVITPLVLASVRNVDINSIPQEVFGKDNVWRDVGGYRYSNAGVIGEKTIMERLPAYPGFNGPVVHVKVDSPSPKMENQRPYVAIENLNTVDGQWAYEVSHLVLAAPSRLVHTGWRDDPIIALTDIGMHRPGHLYWMVGGVRLLTDNGRDYYVSVYRVNMGDPGNTPSDRKIPFALGVKQRIRTELFYDQENNNTPSLRAFLVQRNGDSSPTYDFIGKISLDPDIDRISGKDITKLGIYVGRLVTGFEGISGEAQIYR